MAKSPLKSPKPVFAEEPHTTQGAVDHRAELNPTTSGNVIETGSSNSIETTETFIASIPGSNTTSTVKGKCMNHKMISFFYIYFLLKLVLCLIYLHTSNLYRVLFLKLIIKKPKKKRRKIK